MYKAILVDNEQKCLNRLRTLISESCADTIVVVGEYKDYDEAIQAIEIIRPDILFLDVQLGQGNNSFGLLGAIEENTSEIIFVTAHNKYAINAFDVDAVDCLLKPVSTERLNKAVSKVINKLQSRHRDQAVSLKSELKALGIPNSKDGESIDEYITIEEILYCQAVGNYTAIFGLRNGKAEKLALATKPLVAFESVLASKGFFKIHQATLINIKYFKVHVKGRGGFALMENGTRLKIAPERLTEFKKFLLKNGLVKLA